MGTNKASTGLRLAETDTETKLYPDLIRRASGQRRAFLYESMVATVGNRIGREELGVHFTHMPARYWTRVDEETLRGHLELIHVFLKRLRGSNDDSTRPVVRWRHRPDRGVTTVEICTWDRLGLLARVAGAFAAVGLNIVRADIFTRADNVVLDIFEVCNADQGPVLDESRLDKMVRLLAMALRPSVGDQSPAEPFTFVPSAGSRRRTPSAPSFVAFAPGATEAHTVLIVETYDEVGLLYRIFSALAAMNVNCVHAIISTEGNRVGDVFFLADADGCKITETERLEPIRQRVLQSISER